MTENNESPCIACNKVKDPADCENKNCNIWRKWFISKWKTFNAFSEKWSKENG